MDSSSLEPLCTGTLHLDTVRALHQTVVSLRTALELSKNELKELKEKYEKHSHCNDYADVIEKLTIENHVLRRKIIDYDGEFDKPKIKLELSYSPDHNINTVLCSTEPEAEIKSVTPDAIDSSLENEDQEISAFEIISKSDEESVDEGCNTAKEVQLEKADSEVDENSSPNNDDAQSHVSISQHETNFSSDTSYKTKLELLSKFDVKIKVRTIKEGTITSSTSETDSSDEKQGVDKPVIIIEQEDKLYKENEEVKVKSISKEDIKMAVPNDADVKSKNDKFDVQVRITSEENLVVKEGFDRHKRKETLNLDVYDLSFRSVSEGDNSVFTEEGGQNVGADPADKMEQENSENDSEEVDDIELIFTTDESKDMSNLQEDLVPIRETDHWTPSPTLTSTTHSTPVLIKFHTLDPDFQPGGETTENAENENQENTSLQNVIAQSTLRMKRVSLPSDKDMKHVGFTKSLDLPGRGILKATQNKSENMLFRKSPTSSRRIDSIDSLSCEYNRNMSLDNTKSSSFEGSSMDMLQRDESVDSFQRGGHFGHRYSVFAETDISKCGVSEDDIASNTYLRRNTCPNPFQYRSSVSRGPPRPMKGVWGRGRGRRCSGAQTEVTALPSWSSDGHLAHAPRPPPAPLPRPAPRPSRRQLLSDLGFTSMVPELSRSADPVWAACSTGHIRGTAPGYTGQMGQTGMVSQTGHLTIGHMTPTGHGMPMKPFREQYLSVDDYAPQPIYVPVGRVSSAWRVSLPDVRADDTDELMEETEMFLRRSVDNLRSYVDESPTYNTSALRSPYIPSEPRHLRVGHVVKLITPHGRLAVGRVRYVGLAGVSSNDSSVMVGAIFPLATHQWLPLNDGTYKNRRYFHAPSRHTALFVPFSKVVMAWAN